MKTFKFIILASLLFSASAISAQFSFVYTPADSIYKNVGGWSLKPMYAQKDSTANPDSYFIKFYHPNIQFVRYKSTTNNGVPTSIVWLTNDGYFRRSPVDSLKIKYVQIINFPGSSAQYLRGDGSVATLPAVPTATSQLTNDSGFITSEVDGSTTNEIELPSQTGNSGKYLTTNGSDPSWVAPKRQETYSGTTSGSGTYTVTFGTAYSVAPNIQANIVGGTNTNFIRITSVSTTGFTVTVMNRTDIVGLLPSYAVQNGITVDILITEK